MIELSQIQNTSKLKELRGQINTMVNEINSDQMVVGQVLHPTAQLYYNGSIVGSISDSWIINQLFAVCMPTSNGVYVAQMFGCLLAYGDSVTNNTVNGVKISIPAVKLPNRTAEVSSFVKPSSLGFSPFNLQQISNTGLKFGATVTGPSGSTTVVTDKSLSSSTATLLNQQCLVYGTTGTNLHLQLDSITI